MLVLLRDGLRLRVPLEPRQVLDVKTPGLPFELLRSEIPVTMREEVGCDAPCQSVMRADIERRGLDSLLVCARVVVEHVEECLDVKLREDPRRVQQRMRHLRVVRGCLDRVSRYVVLRPG